EDNSKMRLAAISLGFIILTLDLITKWWVQSTSWLQNYRIIEGFLTIHYVQNEGIAFGLFHSLQSPWKPVILSVLAIIAVVIVLYYIRITPLDKPGLLASLGLLLGGILGNFIERLVHSHVTDFIELHWQDYFSWPTFNVADSAITCGVLFILYETFLGDIDSKIQDNDSI
ncbi:MAG: signal peptidase II, partial [Acidobacteria bacterium]|nr:signal peptidase II [Acidobacteriota bacterium]